MSLLKNAVESIQVGVEDFESDDDKRSVSAMRNIAAGLLLLFKAKLCRLSPPSEPELLIKKDLIPTIDEKGNVNFIGRGRKTVDVAQIRERFSSMEIEVDWRRVEEITNLRNELEHYYARVPHDVVREVVAKSFILIRDFSQKALDESPQDLLGNDCWQVLLKTSEVYLAEERACRESLDAIDWKYETVTQSLAYLRCSACGSALIEAPYSDDVYPVINLHCKSCNEDFCFSDVLEECVDELLSVDAYTMVKDGGDSPYGTCPHCARNTFIVAEGCCVACEEELEYTECYRCSDSLSVEDQHLDGLCSYCKYQFDKVMAE